ncbi:hypothetical protein [Nonomuraea endophytica]|uniref:hypothetical protein n=1 Tax=Nonomuraea endophytica TaxID=714136 RepID=UPI0037C67D0E
MPVCTGPCTLLDRYATVAAELSTLQGQIIAHEIPAALGVAPTPASLAKLAATQRQYQDKHHQATALECELIQAKAQDGYTTSPADPNLTSGPVIDPNANPNS